MNVELAVSFIDIFIGLVLIWAIYKGYKRGPVVQAVSLLIIILGIALFGSASVSIADYIRERSTVDLPNLHIIFFIIFFAASVWLSNFVGNKIEKTAAKPKGFLNIFLGILANVIKYIYLLSILLLLFAGIDNKYDLVGRKEKKNSKLYETVRDIAPNTIKTVEFLRN
jgi:membrane protein required for colicin V production